MNDKQIRHSRYVQRKHAKRKVVSAKKKKVSEQQRVARRRAANAGRKAIARWKSKKSVSA